VTAHTLVGVQNPQRTAVILLHRHESTMKFPIDPVVCFLEVDISCVRVFKMHRKFLENLLEGENSLTRNYQRHSGPPAQVNLGMYQNSVPAGNE